VSDWIVLPLVLLALATGYVWGSAKRRQEGSGDLAEVRRNDLWREALRRIHARGRT
jgi:hypothetical protein